MIPPTDEVDGDRAYDPKLKTWIQFSSRTDALLASFVLQHNFTFNQLNVVLKVIRDQGFDASGATLDSPADVLRAVSHRGKALASERSRSEQVWEVLKPGIPSVVLQLVVDSMMEELPSLEEESRYYAPLPSQSYGRFRLVRPFYSIRQDLRNLTLVHRAWTPIVRKALQRRIFITTWEHLEEYLCSVYCGPEVGELILEIDGKFVDKMVSANCSYLFAALFARSPNIHSLCLKIDGRINFRSGTTQEHHQRIRDGMAAAAKNAIEGMKSLAQLHRLWLIAELSPETSWLTICESISCLNSLRFISIAGWLNDQHEGTELFDALLSHSPPQSLKTVELRSFGPVPKQVLFWLFAPSLLNIENTRTASPAIENAAVNLSEGEACLLFGENTEAQQALSNFWSSLRSLDCIRGRQNFVQQALQLCTDLHHLTIEVGLFLQLAADFVILPKHLEHLTLKCYDTKYLGIHDKAVSDLLNKASDGAKSRFGDVMMGLRRLDFHLHHSESNGLRACDLERRRDNVGFYQPHHRDFVVQTSTACHALNIEFSIAKFLDFGGNGSQYF